MDRLNINGIQIGRGQKVLIVAEIGLNHNGSAELACEMIQKAKKCGADAVKFQTFNTDKFITKQSKYYSIFKNAQLDRNAFRRIKEESKKCNIWFFSTPFDFESADLLEALDVPLYKVASGDLTNIPLIKYVASKNKPIIISTGMGTVEEINNAIKTSELAGNSDVALLHCVSNYPAKAHEMNLRTIPWLAKTFKKPVGNGTYGF